VITVILIGVFAVMAVAARHSQHNLRCAVFGALAVILLANRIYILIHGLIPAVANNPSLILLIGVSVWLTCFVFIAQALKHKQAPADTMLATVSAPSPEAEPQVLIEVV
jgi:uncharacterized protein involved in cysteine biosynthesis